MKYAIYDKAANGYLTKMEFEVGYSEHTQFECGLNEYITGAKLLDTKKEATDAVARIESTKFMEKGRFVIHSFDDTFKNKYIISEAGTPTKVVDNITVDLGGNVNVKYGTMMSHWSTISLSEAVYRLDRLQDAVAPVYGPWRSTFGIYKVITMRDENEYIHYQFVKVTEKCLDFAKEESPLNKRIEELEKANYELGERVAERGIVANRLLDENNSLKAKVEAIKKEAHDWKKLYENADADREELKNAIDFIHTDLVSSTACDDLKDTLKAINSNSGLDNISMENFLTAKDEIRSIINHVITIMESRELNKNVAFSSAEDVKLARDIANDIIPICEADDPFEVTLKKFSELHEAVNAVYNTKNDPIIHAFNSVLLIFSTMDSKLENFADEIVSWKNKAQKAEKALDDQKKLNDANKATIAYLTINKIAKDKELSDAADALKEANNKNEGLTNILKEIADCVIDIMVATRSMDTDTDKMISNLTDVSLKMGMKTTDDGPIHGILVILNTLIKIAKEKNDKAKEIKTLRDTRGSLAEVIFAIRNAICNNDSDAFRCINSRMIHDADFNSDPFMAGVRENIKDICSAEKTNISNNDLNNSEIVRLTKERNKALEQKEFYKRQANSVYGMTIPVRCCGKQVFADVATGKKIIIDKKKYDDLVGYINAINLTYDAMFCMMDKPVYLSTITESLNDLTK